MEINANEGTAIKLNENQCALALDDPSRGDHGEACYHIYIYIYPPTLLAVERVGKFCMPAWELRGLPL